MRSSADLWPPLAPLGLERGDRLERAIGGASTPEVDELLGLLARDASPAEAAAVAAGRFALAQRSGRLADAEGEEAERAFVSVGDPRAAAFVAVERAAGRLSDRSQLVRIDQQLDAIEVAPGDLALRAAVDRGRGATARARADLRGSLLLLERGREAAEQSGAPREILRNLNTLGTSYAALGVASLARDALERARELAELAGQRQSAAIAAGQLGVLALDAGRPDMAVRHLTLQLRTAERLDDEAGQARALSLLVEAHGLAHDLARAGSSASACRALYTRSPSPWTRLQASLATLYEAELVLAGGDERQAAELLRSCRDERDSEVPALRVIRARGSLVLLTALASPGAELSAVFGPSLPGRDRPLDESLAVVLARLLRSPRPTWVERALGTAIEAARRHGRGDLIAPLGLRAAALTELRAAASSGALPVLRERAPAAAVARAMSLGRELVLRARRALAPLGPYEAEHIELRGDDATLDRALGFFDDPARPGELADAVQASLDGDRLRLAVTDPVLADRGWQMLATLPDLRSPGRERRLVEVVADSALTLPLVAR